MSSGPIDLASGPSTQVLRGLTAEEASRVSSYGLHMMTGRAIIVLFLALLIVVLLYQGPGLIRSKGWSATSMGVVAMLVVALAAEIGMGWIIRADVRLMSMKAGEPVFELSGRYWKASKNTSPSIGSERVELALAKGTVLPSSGDEAVAELIRNGSRKIVVSLRPASSDGN